MPTAPTLLKTSRLLIRHAQSSDIPNILRFYTENEAHLAPFEPLKPSVFYTKRYWDNEIYQRLIDTQEEKTIKLFIFLKKTRGRSQNPVIGTLNFSNMTRGVFQNCTVGYSLAERHQGKGYMSEALTAGLRYILIDLKFHRVGANYLPHNQRSGKLLKRLGFTVNGYAPDYLYIAGKWQDHVLASFVNTKHTQTAITAASSVTASPVTNSSKDLADTGQSGSRSDRSIVDLPEIEPKVDSEINPEGEPEIGPTVTPESNPEVDQGVDPAIDLETQSDTFANYSRLF